ncbi:MAG: hypothetical protein KAT15_28600, partial [Bacteroidales bacterium]|nr:hypothetical protein [Bacteroidales bacterium]
YNEYTYSDEALQIALDHNLTIMGTSDIHGLIDWQFGVSEGGHRPVTLAFASEKSKEALKEAFVEGRTAVWFDNTLVGDQEYLVPLITQSLEVTRQGRSPVQQVLIKNNSDADYILKNISPFTLHNQASVFTVKAHTTTQIQVKTLDTLSILPLRFRVLNAYSTPAEHPEISIEIE